MQKSILSPCLIFVLRCGFWCAKIEKLTLILWSSKCHLIQTSWSVLGQTQLSLSLQLPLYKREDREPILRSIFLLPADWNNWGVLLYLGLLYSHWSLRLVFIMSSTWKVRFWQKAFWRAKLLCRWLSDQWHSVSLLESQLCGCENRLSEIKGCCGEAEGWQQWEMRWRRSSLKFYSHSAPSTASKFSVHTALCIAIETFLLMTTETSFPTADKESLLPAETAHISLFPRPTSFFRLYSAAAAPHFPPFSSPGFPVF